MSHATTSALGLPRLTLDDRRDRMAEAVWNDLYRDRGFRPAADGNGSTFHYEGRYYSLRHPLTANGKRARGWIVTAAASADAEPFTPALSVTGPSRRAAVTAMVRAAYGRPCPHGCATGIDSCSGCDIDIPA